MHRDVSLGNILSCNGHAKLADLEYAKKRSDLTSHEMQTASEPPITLSGKSSIELQQGTMHFMSIEVAAQVFRFHPPERITVAEFLDRNPGDVGTARTKVPFSHNHLHDLESLWWVAVWIVFYNHFEKTETSVTLENIEKQLKLAQTLFPPILGSNTRDLAFQFTFQELCHRLPEDNRPIGVELDLLRRLLISEYIIVEAKFPESVDPDSSKDDIYDAFKLVFSGIASNPHDLKLNFIANIRKKLLKSREESLKRARSGSTNGTGAASASKTARR